MRNNRQNVAAVNYGATMKMRYSLLLAGLAVIATGYIGMKQIYAQPSPAAAPAYYMAELELTDPDGIRPYSAAVASTFEPFGGRFIVRGGEASPLEGEGPKGRFVVIAFDSMEKAQAWYNSPAYQKLKPIRQRSGNSRTFIVQGIAK